MGGAPPAAAPHGARGEALRAIPRLRGPAAPFK